MLVTEAPRAKGRRQGEALAVGLVGLLVAAAAALLPGDWRMIAIPLALVAGMAIERYRQSGRERPLSLADTPEEWKRAIGQVGWAYTVAALLATGAGLAVLALPELRSKQLGKDATEAERGGQRPVTARLPDVKVLRARPGRPIRVNGASFTVVRAATEPWAHAIHSRRAGRGAIWTVVSVHARNLSRAQFNPNALAYRLRDGRGNRFAPVVGGGTGPASLGRTGFLERGEIAQARLGFRVPRSARRLALMFEPVRDGSIQVEVPLARDRSS